MSTSDKTIEQKIKDAQQAWADGVVDIGRNRGSDVERAADKLLDDCYDFKRDKSILFKPTLASKVPVRINRVETLSYFIAGEVEEDCGFALTPWIRVKFHAGFHCTALEGGNLLVMGRCTFIPPSGRGLKPAVADYTFGYRQAANGLRIFLHHSSLIIEHKD